MKNIHQSTFKYSLTTRLLHWIIAFLLIEQTGLGWYMLAIEKQPGSRWYFNLHETIGFIVAFFILVRIFTRLMSALAPLPNTIPAWQAKLARLLHYSLYVCMILMPVTGFIGASFSRHPVVFLNFELPGWVNQNRELAHQLFNIHGKIAWILVALVALHVIAAFKHLLINRDGVFQRML